MEALKAPSPDVRPARKAAASTGTASQSNPACRDQDLQKADSMQHLMQDFEIQLTAAYSAPRLLRGFHGCLNSGLTGNNVHSMGHYIMQQECQSFATLGGRLPPRLRAPCPSSQQALLLRFLTATRDKGPQRRRVHSVGGSHGSLSSSMPGLLGLQGP